MGGECREILVKQEVRGTYTTHDNKKTVPTLAAAD